MSFEVSVDTRQLEQWATELHEKFGELGSLLEEYAQTEIVPVLEAEAASQRKVRTGRYSGTWESSERDERSAIITTEAFYWIFLEFGTSRGIEPKAVAEQGVKEIKRGIQDYLVQALDIAAGSH